MKPFKGSPTDYSQKKYWLALPEDPGKDTDLIFFYPSSCIDRKAGTICKADNKNMIKTARRNFLQQASAFEPVANLFAPFWRQVNALKLTDMSFDEIDEAEWAQPRTDVYAALDHYFQNLNGGRPYFLAGHSQGSRLIYIVLSEYMKDHPEHYSNMIAAYCLGDSLTKDYLKENPHVKAAQGPDDTGVVVSWNTEGAANSGFKTLVVAPNAVAINPLNWRTDDTPASEDENLGTFVPRLFSSGLNRLSEKADAVLNVERGTVMVSNPSLKRYAITKIPGCKRLESVFGPESYHGCDYSFFYMNIRENALARREAWFRNRGDL